MTSILPLTTTDSFDGYVVTEYHGIVSARCFFGVNLARDWMAKLWDLFGGRIGGYEKVGDEAERLIKERLSQRAQAAGANAVVGVQFKETFPARMLFMSAFGTAVTIAPRTTK